MIRLILILATLGMGGVHASQPVAHSPEFEPSQDTVPNFVLPNFDGEEVDLESLMGERFTLIDFWATWCGPCVQSIPAMVHLADSLKEQGVRVVGVSVDSPRNQSKVAPYARSLGITYPVLLDVNSEVMADLNVQAMPTLLVIDRDRELVYLHEGFRPGDDRVIFDKLLSLLSESQE